MLKIIVILSLILIATIFISYKPSKYKKKKHTPKIIYKQDSSTSPSLVYPKSIDSLMRSQGMGCGELKRFDMDSFNRGEPQTSCAPGIDGKLAGDFEQICATQDLKVVDCNKENSNPYNPHEDVYYMTDITDQCKCLTYMSEAQGNNVNYKGKYCQYNDKQTCNNSGVVDDNGNCKCNTTYAGNTCQYSNKQNCNDKGDVQNDGSCICNTYFSYFDHLDKNYMGNQCQYDDYNSCKNQGKVDNNGNCKWDPAKVFPRCAELVDPDETDYNKLQCKTTVKPDLFSTNCIPRGLDSIIPPQEFGCPINKKSTIWAPITGYSCHTKDSDNHQCINGAYPVRLVPGTTNNGTTDWVIKNYGVCQTNGEGFEWNACRIDDVSKVESLNNIDFSGITNKTVTGIGSVACPQPNFFNQTVTLSNSPNNPYPYGNNKEGITNACWGNSPGDTIYAVSERDWFNDPIGRDVAQKI